MRLPNFFIIGAMKAATSTLHDQLAAQPGLLLSEPKELYFFSDDDVWDNGLDWYTRHFAAAAATDLCGESSTHYAKLPTYPNTIERIAANVSDPKFIYVMRQPIDRLLSQYQHMMLEREISMSFDEALQGGVPELVEYSRYAMQIRPFLDRFGPDSVLPVFFDHMLTHSQTELERVCSFLGYDGSPVWHEQTESNITSERLAVSPARDRLKALPLFELARKLVPDAAIDRVRDRWRAGPAPTMSADQLTSVESIINEDLADLGRLLGTSLTCANFREVTRAQPIEWSSDIASKLGQS